MGKKLRLILGDQLNIKHSWYKKVDPEILYCLMEVRSESLYVKHHIQKIVGFFKAMRSFAAELSAKGHEVLYLKIGDPENRQNFKNNILQILQTKKISEFEYQEPDEYRLEFEFAKLAKENKKLTINVCSTEHFIAERAELTKLFGIKKSYVMESFYRVLRKRTGYLMEDEAPSGGIWNYDKENRSKLPKGIKIPVRHVKGCDVSELYQEILTADLPHFGQIDPSNYVWECDRPAALKALDFFAKNLLQDFGTYEDAMSESNDLLFHSLLSFSLNLKLISPTEVIERCLAEWSKHQEQISLSQIEGFVRQILGWREYMRCIYWAKMPEYKSLNFLAADAELPQQFWSGATKMNCMQHALTRSLEGAHAHHIQRLMVIGNFALLAGINPDEVDAWYLGVYIDAIEWVQLPNTRGMSQYADGGITATKPYIASANYINNMSDYCKSCFYENKTRGGAKGCPLNTLYWEFLIRNKELLKTNARMGIPYKSLERFSGEELEKIKKEGQNLRDNLDFL